MASVLAGRRVTVVAEEVGYSADSVYAWLKTAGVNCNAQANHRVIHTTKGLRKQWSPRRKQLNDRVCELVNEHGRSALSVARELGLSDQTVTRWARQARLAAMPGATRRELIARGTHLSLSGFAPWHIATELGVSPAQVATWIDDGLMPVAPAHPRAVQAGLDTNSIVTTPVGRGRTLSLADRCQIRLLSRKGLSCREIGKQIGRDHTVVSREIKRNALLVAYDQGDEEKEYDPDIAQYQATQRRKRPRQRKLDQPGPLRAEVLAMLARKISPGRIACRLKAKHPHNRDMHISHEAIYSALYIQTAGSLRKELEDLMNTKQVLIRAEQTRTPRNRVAGLHNKNWVYGSEITTRPPEADDRAIPGHWEGDLVLGKNQQSALITLIERRSRFTLLYHLPD
ncbi:IS30 family transposase, partial [Corynebacterium sp. H127]